MAEIKMLDPGVIRLIAAGEVVERPASVVKELTENALDAGAKHIAVEILKGGLRRIRVTDDGCGMAEEDAQLAFRKHATSKISTAADLERIRTLGFRGEALAAISSVSHVTLTTKRQEDPSGRRLTLSGGKLETCEECGCPDGSCFTVEDLFFNTPARLKFMKSEPAEAGAIQNILERLSLSHPEVSFRLTVNGAEKLHTPGGGDLRQAIFSVFGREYAEMLLPADRTEGSIRVHGFVGKPVYTKANRGRQVFFLNGRYVRSAVFVSGLENAYHNKMLIGRMPVCVLFVDLPEDQADINVHPGKLEVKFSDESAVAYAVRKATESALTADTGIVPIPLRQTRDELSSRDVSTSTVLKASLDKRFFQKFVPETKQEKPLDSMPKKVPEPVMKIREKDGWTISAPCGSESSAKSVSSMSDASVMLHDVGVRVTDSTASGIPPVFPPIDPDDSLHITAKNTDFLPKTDTTMVMPDVEKNTRSSGSLQDDGKSAEPEPVLFETGPAFRLIGEAFRCYAIVERGDEILFIDKHALHERMNFERLRKSDISSQMLLQPLILSLGAEENRILSENADFLSRFGFLLETFGDDLLIREIPALIDPDQAEPLLQEFADSLSVRRDDSLLDRFYYDIACKASIRSGSETSLQELEQLIEEYFRRAEELQYCPHGRPIVFSLPRHSIEKQFKRVK